MGKARHIEHIPECKIVPQAEHFDNRCPECDRNFRNPSELKEHRRYICTQQKEGKQQTESDTKEPIPKQMKSMPIKEKEAETISRKANHEKEKEKEHRKELKKGQIITWAKEEKQTK